MNMYSVQLRILKNPDELSRNYALFQKDYVLFLYWFYLINYRGGLFCFYNFFFDTDLL